MLRVIFDTNVYGLLVMEINIGKIQVQIANDKDFIIYGAKIIRDELRETPGSARLGKLKIRNLLLNLYDRITFGRRIEYNHDIERLALEFYLQYRILGGIKAWKEISSDFKIVAHACMNGLDIVVSEDSRTMLSTIAIKAYKEVALRHSIRLPYFWRYKDIKNKFGF